MHFEDFYSQYKKDNNKQFEEKEIIDEYNIELNDSIIKININYILDKNKYEVFLCVVDNKYTKYITNILNKTFDNKEEAYSYFNDLKKNKYIRKIGKININHHLLPTFISTNIFNIYFTIFLI